MLDNVKRISIIGGPGAGKTTLAKNIGKELNIPVCHIDGIHYLENWKLRDQEEQDRIILEKVKEAEWIMDGTYKSTLVERVEKADMVIFLDYSTIARLKSVWSRHFKTMGKEKPEIPGCKGNMTYQFMKFSTNWNKIEGNDIKQLLKDNKDKEILVFKNRKLLNKWYEEQFNKKIEI